MAKAGLSGTLRAWRERAALTQQDLADRAGLSVGALRDLEQGRVAAPRPATLHRLAAALALSEVETAKLVRLGRPNQPDGYELRIRVLGPLGVTIGGERVDLGSAKQRALLAVLAVTPNEAVPLDTIVEALWGADPPDNAAALVQNHASRLRQRLRPRQPADAAERLLVAARGGYQLTAGEEQVDLLEFRRLVEQARAAYGDGDLAAACERYQQATALWRGDPLADLGALRNLPALAALERERRGAVVGYADAATALGHHDRVLPALRAAAEADPLDEAVHARLILALAGDGRQAEALRVYEALRRRLADELGADPGAELAAAHRRVLRQEVPRPAGGSPPVSAHRQLPPDIAEFTGRESELDTLCAAVPPPGEAGTLVISTIEGMAGVGKTRLAVRLAHQLVASGRYTDIQLYVDLRGHADEPPADPATVLGSFLRLLGVHGAEIPEGLDERAALYRDRLHGRHALVVLDNAASDEQVLPLLPASPTSLVLVTSRRVLALDGAHTLNLDVFTARDAYALLGRIAGEARVAAEPEAARRVADLCGRLPLAVVLAAHRLRSRPTWTLADLARRLADAGDRLRELSVGARQVQGVFDLSYRALDPAGQRLFRLLGLHPGDDFTAESAAALAGVPAAAARQALERLVDEHLVTPVTSDRYRLHDLLRDYARAQARASGADAAAAVDRILTWYVYAAEAAVRLIFPQNVEVVLDARQRPDDLPAFGTEERAFAWLTAEQTTLVAAVHTAAAHGRHEVAWRLPAILRLYFERRSNWQDWRGTSQIALDAARQLGDRHAEALILNGLGLGYSEREEPHAAIEHLSRSLELRRAIGDRQGEGRTLNNIGITYGRMGRFDDAIEYFTASLEIRRELSSQYDQSMTLGNLGRAYSGAGRHQEAIECLREALEVRRSLGDPVGVAWALYNLGVGLAGAGEFARAHAPLAESAEIFGAKHCTRLQAGSLEVLGDSLMAAGEPDRARECWERSLALFDSVNHPQAAALRTRLAEHPPVPVPNP